MHSISKEWNISENMKVGAFIFSKVQIAIQIFLLHYYDLNSDKFNFFNYRKEKAIYLSDVCLYIWNVLIKYA